MKNPEIGNYEKHARYWDWGGYDDAVNDQFWFAWAGTYGDQVLIPMAALGRAGAYMAERGMTVACLDYTESMVKEGRRRYGHIPGFRIEQGDVRDFHIDMHPADFAYSVDLGHLHSIEDLTAAFRSIAEHLRDGAGLVVEIGLPPRQSVEYPKQRFDPLKAMYPGLKIWKTGSTRMDAREKRTYYDQTMYIESAEGTEAFRHAFYLQHYERDELIRALRDAGFWLAGEYRDRERNPWRSEDGLWIGEAIKQ